MDYIPLGATCDYVEELSRDRWAPQWQWLMKEQGQQRVNGDERSVAAPPPLVRSKAPVWAAEQTYLRRSLVHKINLGDINLKGTRLTAAVKVFNGRQSKKKKKSQACHSPSFCWENMSIPRVLIDSNPFLGAMQPPNRPSELNRILQNEPSQREVMLASGQDATCRWHTFSSCFCFLGMFGLSCLL